MQKHTPGPWHIGGANDQIIYAESGFAVADAKTYHGVQPLYAMAANARLIAAAPDLLRCLEGLCGLAEMRPGHLADYKAAVQDARAAIAKATDTPRSLADALLPADALEAVDPSSAMGA